MAAFAYERYFVSDGFHMSRCRVQMRVPDMIKKGGIQVRTVGEERVGGG